MSDDVSSPVAGRSRFDRRLLAALGGLALLVAGAVAGWWLLFRQPPRYADRFTPRWRIPAKPISILTYNIEFGNRLAEALEVIRRESPDVVCLQEIRQAQLPEIERSLSMSGVWWPSSNLFGGGEWGNVVLARGSVGEAHSIPGAPAGSFGVWAAVECHGGRFIVASIHLMHMKTAGAGFQAREREIRALVDAVEKSGAPILVAGDFNNPPMGGNYELLTARLTDLGAGTGATLPSSFPLLRADYIFGTKEWQGESARRVDVTVSDHLPVIAVVRAGK
jgi:endonuclease/exonuclease/phosphatase family metal-dependent hydrolase